MGCLKILLSSAKNSKKYLLIAVFLIGWFYTSLLTGVALTGAAPYKQIFVHGFTLDENGNKVINSVRA